MSEREIGKESKQNLYLRSEQLKHVLIQSIQFPRSVEDIAPRRAPRFEFHDRLGVNFFLKKKWTEKGKKKIQPPRDGHQQQRWTSYAWK